MRQAPRWIGLACWFPVALKILTGVGAQFDPDTLAVFLERTQHPETAVPSRYYQWLPRIDDWTHVDGNRTAHAGGES